MAQPPEIMAFRKRLHNRGYEDIQISMTKFSGLYHVEAVEPALRQRVAADIDTRSMMLRCHGRKKVDR